MHEFSRATSAAFRSISILVRFRSRRKEIIIKNLNQALTDAPRRACVAVRAAAVNTSSYGKVEKVREGDGEGKRES
jgi:hypothetical protein